jgi:hypothetical protein
VLNAHGCGGPYCLLVDLRRVLEKVQVSSGTWKDKTVVRLTGSVKSGAPTAAAPQTQSAAAVPARLCHVYLDARTLWLHRVEWWTAPGPERAPCLALQLEFRAPVINQPLTREDCIREFTYQP